MPQLYMTAEKARTVPAVQDVVVLRVDGTRTRHCHPTHPASHEEQDVAGSSNDTTAS